ncbi:proline dehydrogenase [Acidovorax sp. Be4]|uniref:Proline dehydrogenase n=1 Tax=Acidovorax bellezanensis TaxID=2976702 RepID=A0ABT2PU96_9BURK|nr:carbamoyltransferase C-terminal domain-containing protein [Acidovorax sp. Be4]MCT9812852.1 proline dehydrogenase [Acidovorax sp. Be4]
MIASGGWSEGIDPEGTSIEAGYLGINRGSHHEATLAGKPIFYFSSSHERSHLLCAYGLSPFKQGNPCYALVWEGYIGSIYFINENIEIMKLREVLLNPGHRYAFLYALADPSFSMYRGAIRLSDAGKLMAISAFSTGKSVPKEGRDLIDRILDPQVKAKNFSKEDFKSYSYYNCGITHPDFADLAKLLADRIYQTFENAARSVITKKYPLLISGGCGLNCEWNSKWISSGLFSDVFIPPCTNDSGSAIGTAVDAMLELTGRAKVRWNVYSGENPTADINNFPGFIEYDYDPAHVASLLMKGNVFGWMRGRYEIGPRSLGARSILASPVSPGMLNRLNSIKNREFFRPIAPVCLEEDMEYYFYPSTPSPYMLEFRKVISPSIPAVTHIDGSSRPQSISNYQNPVLHQLLLKFKEISGISVLCNTSLNFNGNGFLNKLSDLYKFSLEKNLDGFVFENRTFIKKTDANLKQK